MSSVDFSKLNGSSFERLAAALCFKEIGIQGNVFPAGADGARDFCFEGEIPSLGWRGYVVVQAKFRESNQSGSEAAWIVKKIKEEAAKYAARSLRVPDYYILLTNVNLSGADSIATKNGKITIGGLERANNEMRLFSKAVGMKDFAIWPKTKIQDLLNLHPVIRQSFAAWITPGDVIARLFESLPHPSRGFESIIRKSLRNGLRRDRLARLKDAGDVNDPQIRTSQVFVDLPFNSQKSRSSDESEASQKLVAAIVERAAHKFNYDLSGEAEGAHSKERAGGSKVVILGGPGQGKSTASLFAAQLFRAAILRTASEQYCDAATRASCDEILARAGEQSIPTALALRYPLFISLPKFADDVSVARQQKMSPPSLISHIAKELGALSDHEVATEPVRLWLAQYPWLLILDGLDEVPPSGERAQTLEAIARLEGEVTDAKADALIIVTTRPQGYNEDLSTKDWEHWTLSDLPIKDALAYGKALGFARYPEDEQRRKEVFELLRGAGQNPATARLMISPLQVTIMHMIVDTGGGIPTARWSLFNEYFEVLRKREKSKGGENQKILEKNWSHLGPIHQRAGLILQTDSERSGSAESYLTQERFYRLVKGYFDSIGDDAPDSELRCRQLVDVALHRLVLLSARDEGRITFDVRSMQEYMAAGALTSGAPKNVENRLLHISRASHWRHVSLIAASRCFAEDVLHHLRITVASIPRQIEVSGLDALTKTGAKFALDLFVDGIGSDHPTSRKMLARHALELLVPQSDTYDSRLIKINESSCEEVLKGFLSEQLSANKPGESAAWAFAMDLSSAHGGCYTEILHNAWPSDHKEVLSLIKFLSVPVNDVLVGESVISAIRNSNPMDFLPDLVALARKTEKYVFRLNQDPRKMTEIDRRLCSLTSSFHGSDYRFAQRFIPVHKSPLHFLIQHPNSSDTLLDELAHGPLHEGWASFLLISEYNRTPTSAKLKSILDRCSIKQFKIQIERVAQPAPWPLSAIWEIAGNAEELKIARDAIKTSFIKNKGGRESIVEKWMLEGVSVTDIVAQHSKLDSSLKILTDAPTFGTRVQITSREKDSSQNFVSFCKASQNVQQPALRKKLRFIAACSTVAAVEVSIPLFAELPGFLEDVSKDNSCSFSSLLGAMGEEVWADDVCAGLLAKISINAVWFGEDYRFNVQAICEALRRVPANRGLLVAVIFGMAHQGKIDFDVLTRIESHLIPASGDQSRVAAAIFVLKALKGSARESLPRALVENRQSKDLLIFVLVRLSQELSSNVLELFAPSLLGARGDAFRKGERELITAIDQNLAKRKSELEKPKIWSELLAIWADAHAILRRSDEVAG